MSKKTINLSKFTTYKFGGNATSFFEIKSENDLLEISKKFDMESVYILGKGSNIVFSDSEHDYPILNSKLIFINTTKDNNVLEIGSGVYLPDLSRFLKSQNFTGGEFMLGIPGSVGGAFAMNAGCYGNEFFDNLLSVRVFDFKSKSIYELLKSDIEYGYRKVNLKNVMLLSVKMQFHKDNPTEIKNKNEKFYKLRKISQPPAIYNAGSVFKNGKDYFAGKLIEESGLKGFRLKDVRVSEKHANFFIADKGAKALNLYNLVQYVKDEVAKKFSIELEEEIIFKGKF